MAAAEAGLFTEGLILLSGAIVAAPLFKKLGLGTVLGYLAAGIVIGPLLRFITDGEEILHFAELGVVLLLFIIGLELKPSRLWQMRRDIFGLGLTQVMVSAVVILAATMAIAGQNWAAAIIIGFGLALSSTAFGIQILDERGDLNTRYGQKSFSILLFQDLAIVPILALVPLVAPVTADSGGSLVTDIAITIGAIAALLIAGRYLLNPMFQLIAEAGAKEAMIAAALFVVLASGMLMQVAGLSMALGAFIAGVMLAESSYRHELEADIEPFRGILLGLFFMAVGLSLDLSVIADNILLIAIAVPVLMGIKALVIYGACRAFGSNHNDSVQIAGLLPQGGEFGFVIFSAAAAAGVFSPATASLLVAIVTLSMALTPVAAVLARRLMHTADHEQMEEDFADAGSDVLMIGFSRFGQIASQMLLAGGSDVTIIEHSADRIRSASKFGFKIYFGDGTRKDVLIAAGIKRAKIVAVCTQKMEVTDRIVDLIQAEFPTVRIFARAYDRTHTLSLRARDVEYELRETFESGLVFGRKTLEALGTSEDLAHEISNDVRRRDEERLALQAVEGIMAGREKLLTRPVTPEPLIKPKRESERLDKPLEPDISLSDPA
ncbi:MAG: monovalent cation:proton antiporter-2 (CPA2) family protein [Hoeflea sp.]|uniref:monovalent cation:proton antiporter-2 (CPA2) family protein n=1 Tax=Hoeflea sp. TaxID=1940281 RepID=UPI001D7DD623|nr:monovalent cation:proton antiporter-2 (CPA2) family protein [Hoeflea sp.]MBU4529116.1 monovalent cation:proton antiporter-2 (CPA2) family protein [Alphaproteobacteria bacterium]MBU4543521.1 monovalent cation:proton antiporter-2 (CPA2) family protein [Alphaproteobacteria bacterium]MBU4549146.1 monovalent cation:proton antiporter-2 (CPA2) family protein [Alphaproteobacteria bacterium]MBV1725281.1 monovalent cation:proton antiporter-2 (CPA2) family protein [Hoeflea sp.]MBV1785242.1 monovalent 